MSLGKIEYELWNNLPKDHVDTVSNKDEISTLTDLLIKECGNYRTNEYTHSVCHLFEGYGEGRVSYLNSASLFDVADKVVNITLENAVKNGVFACVDRIIMPIIKYNLSQIDTTNSDFAFKPAILSSPQFIEVLVANIQKFDNNGDPLEGYKLEFCKAKNMGEFFTEYTNGLKKSSGDVSIENGSEILKGVYCDVDGTLLMYGRELGSDTVMYLLKKIDAGVPVTIFTGGDPKTAAATLKELGADSRLLDVKSKSDYVGKTLEICIDDTTPSWQGFRAQTHYSSSKAAMNKEYSQ